MNSLNYMADLERVEKTVQRLFGLPIRELIPHQPQKNPLMDYFCSDIAETFSVSEDEVKEMELMDLVCLMHQMPDYFYEEQGVDRLRLVQMDALREYLICAEKSFIPVMLFLGIPIRAFYEYLESLRCDGKMEKEWAAVEMKLAEMLKRRSRLNGDVGEMTLKEIFIFLGNEKRRGWYPLNGINNYAAEILDAFKMSDLILGRSFEVAMSGRFNIRSVLTKFNTKKGEN